MLLGTADLTAIRQHGDFLTPPGSRALDRSGHANRWRTRHPSSPPGDRHLRPGRAHAEARLDAGSLLPALAGALGLRLARPPHKLGGLTWPLEAASRLPAREITSTLASPDPE